MAELVSKFGSFLSERGVSLDIEGPLVDQIATYKDKEGNPLIANHDPVLVIGTDKKLSLVTRIKKQNPQKVVHVVESNLRRTNAASKNSSRYDNVFVYLGAYPDKVPPIIPQTKYCLVIFKHGINYVGPENIEAFVGTARSNLTEDGLFVASVAGVFNRDQRVQQTFQEHNITDFKTEPFKGSLGGTVFVFKALLNV
ncbi:hypothetical protein HYT02_05135 [Candidatus Gottesmanbacteria bacterium]|nr:hypothetical protein [Candidatus Gottesmanbacteria bacterium]